MTTLAQASLTFADRAVAPAPLRTRPLDHARGHRYQGPRRPPGPDSHRQAAPNLSLLRHVVLLLLMAPKQSRRTRPMRQWRGGCDALLDQIAPTEYTNRDGTLIPTR